MSKLKIGIACAAFAAFAVSSYHEHKHYNKIKNELHQIDSVRFKNAERTLNNGLRPDGTYIDIMQNLDEMRAFWKKEYKAVKDSVAALNSESAKKAYSKGVQVASDSAKTIIKSVK